MSDHTQIWLSCLCLLVLFLPNVLKIIWLNNLLFLSVPDEVYSRNILYTLNLISKLVLLSLGRYLCWLAISSPDYHSPSSEVFQHWHGLLDIFFLSRNFQFLNHVIIIKPKILVPQVKVTLAEFGYPV
jgi:hypothetical protein